MSISDKNKTVAKKTTRTSVGRLGGVSSKRVVTKKAVIKKSAILSEKVSARKIPAKKIVAKKTTYKSDSKIVVKNKKVKSKNQFTEDLVTMPSIPSLRLLEKTEIYRLWYQKNMSRYVTGTARYGGYLFIVLGTVLASSSYLVEKDLLSLSAAVVCSENCVEIPNESLPAGSPIITFPSIPKELTEDLEISLTVQNTEDIRVFLVSSNSGEKHLLEQLDNQSAGQYHYILPVNNLVGSGYTIFAETETSSAVYKFTGPTFSIFSPENLATSTPILDAPSNDATHDIATNTKDSVDGNTSSTKDGTELERTQAIVVTLKKGVDSNYLNIKTGKFLPTKVEVYSKLEFSDEPIFLGLATLVQGEWVFSLSALDLPVANHLVYASFVDNGTTYQTDGISYIPVARESVSLINEADLSILLQKVQLSIEHASLTPATRTELYTSLDQEEKLFDDIQEEEFVSISALRKVKSVMKNETKNLNSLLQYFASAVQVGNPYLINLADSVLTNHYKAIAHNVAVEMGDNSVVPPLTSILALRYQVLKDQVIKSEQSFKTASNNLVARDSDKDGFSDFDEMTLYKTNPLVVDTDADGVSDAVEIIKDFNPNVSDIKSAATMTQNIDEIIFSDTIGIDVVEPIIVNSLDGQDEEVFALIRGKSLPNTFVTIISYTSGTLGIIRTNNTGDFVYTLEKKLVEGNHEIVAVLTDNEGNIVASSRPYHFINEENTFTVAGAGIKKNNLMSLGDNSQTMAQNVTAAMGVVAFGFVLLFLAQALRFRKTIDNREGEIIVA